MWRQHLPLLRRFSIDSDNSAYKVINIGLQLVSKMIRKSVRQKYLDAYREVLVFAGENLSISKSYQGTAL